MIEIGGAVLILLATCMNPVHQLLSKRLKKDQTSPEEYTKFGEQFHERCCQYLSVAQEIKTEEQKQ